MPSRALAIGPDIVISRWPALLGGGGGEGSSGSGGERTRAPPPGPVSHSAREEGGRRGVLAKVQRRGAWDGTKSRRHVVHVCWGRGGPEWMEISWGRFRARLAKYWINQRGLGKPSPCRGRSLSSRMTDQAQVEAEELRSSHMGEIGGRLSAVNAFPGVPAIHFPPFLFWTPPHLPKWGQGFFFLFLLVLFIFPQ